MKNPRLLSDIAFFRTYSAIKSDGYKESWQEVCDRYEKFLIECYPSLSNSVKFAVKYMRKQQVVGSMRALQFAGPGLHRENLRAYNCSAANITSFKDIADGLYLLLCGCGFGYSVKREHTSELPKITAGSPQEYLVLDSREGWCESVIALLNNPQLSFDYSAVRPAGSPVSSGGTASGPEPLRQAHDKIRDILKSAVDRKLKPFEVSDVMCHLADCVVVGGVRRSALICLFDPDDQEMLTYKSGNWWEANSQRGRANISAHMVRKGADKERFDSIVDACFASNAGEPGVVWTDNSSMITNPCVPAGTQILTRQGYQNIETLVDVPVEVWNGFEWSKVTPAITGHNQPMVKVSLSDGRSLTCTTAHKWVTVEGYSRNGVERRKEARQLEIGDKLIKYTFPVIEGGMPIESKSAYSQGFISADGMDDYDFCYIYGSKIACASRMNGEIVGGVCTSKTGMQRWRFKFNVNAMPKSFVPFGWDVASRVEWFAGLLDGDGTVTRDGNLQICSVDKQFLNDTQKLLSTLGIQSKVTKGAKEGMRLMPDGHGGSKEFHCQQSYRLLVNSTSMRQLVKLGLNTVRLDLNKFPNRDASRFVQVVGLEDAGTADIVYCFTEPKRNLGCFEGIVTGQCAEIALQDGGLCNLSEINFSTVIDSHDFAQRAWAATFLGTLQAGLTKFTYVAPKWTENARKEALLGVSITGLAHNWELAEKFLEEGVFEKVAQRMKDWNAEVAANIGISAAARIGCVKPSGTTSTVLGTTSGVHAAHSPHYLRRIRVDRHSPVGKYLQTTLAGTEFIEDDAFVPSNVIVSVPYAMEGALMREKEPAVRFMNRCAKIYQAWIEPSHRRGDNCHNVSATVTYRDNEKEYVKKWLWQNREKYSGMSLLPLDLGTYVQAPFEAITKDRYNELQTKMPAIDLGEVYYGTEQKDERQGESACSGSIGCEIT